MQYEYLGIDLREDNCSIFFNVLNSISHWKKLKFMEKFFNSKVLKISGIFTDIHMDY